MTISRLLALTSLLVLLAACAAPERTAFGQRSPTPNEMAEQAPPAERSMEWGGLIVSSHNLRDRSELVILAYPLEAGGRPDLQATPRGRFVAVREGYLETLDYAAGRAVTVSGPVTGLRDSRIGDVTRRLPLLDIQRITLWEQEAPRAERPRVHFGISGGSRGTSGVGIGIGF